MKTGTSTEESKYDGAERITPISPSRKLINWAVSLTVESIRPYVHSGCMKFAKSRSLKNKKTRFIFAFEDSAPIGFCAYRLENKTCFIYELHVHPECRSQQVGTRMLNCVIMHVIGMVESIALQVHKDNKRAEAFYMQHGFVHDDTLETSFNYNPMRMFLGRKNIECF